MNQENSDYSFDFVEVILFLNKWKVHLLIITALAAISAAIFSGPAFITPKYKSKVVFYPTTNNSISDAILDDQSANKKDPLEFGEEEQAEQMLQILYSDDMKSRIIKKFGLMEHYEIDPDDELKFTKLSRQYKKNISFKRTPYSSIEITVLDKDPVMAANIANGISDLVDTIKTAVQRQVALQGLQIVEEQYRKKEQEVIGIRDSLQALGELGVFNVEEQSKGLMELYVKAKERNNAAQIKALEEQLHNLAKYGSAYISLNELLQLESEKISDLKKVLDQRRVDVESQLPHKFLISPGSVAEIKSYPIRWLLVVVSTMAAFILGCLVLVVIERVPKILAKKQS